MRDDCQDRLVRMLKVALAAMVPAMVAVILLIVYVVTADTFWLHAAQWATRLLYVAAVIFAAVALMLTRSPRG
jgi:hypothetical protein